MTKFITKKASTVVIFAAIIGAMTFAAVKAQTPEQPRNNWQRFTQPARKIIAAAETKAKQSNRSEVGTELILWALVSDENNEAAEVLQSLNVPLDAIRLQVESEIAWTGEQDSQAETKLTAGGKRVLEFAVEEANRAPNGNRDIDTEHLLLGILRQKEDLPLSYTILRRSGVTLEKARKQVADQ